MAGATVDIANPQEFDTNVDFPGNGDYTLRLTVNSDGPEIVEEMEYGRISMLSQMSRQMGLNAPAQVATVRQVDRQC